MFTGIVEEIGTVGRVRQGRHSAVLDICAATVLQGAKTGDSIAVNGVCLTVTALGPGVFSADVMHETLARSTLAGLVPGSHVNLERAMPANGRFGGHMVAGHIDGTGRITRIQRDDTAVWFTIQAGPAIMRYVVQKGSVAVDGISLTVARVGGDTFAVSVIPHTLKHTVLHEKKQGAPVNLETDIIGKYIEKLLPASAAQRAGSGITRELLAQYGF